MTPEQQQLNTIQKLLEAMQPKLVEQPSDVKYPAGFFEKQILKTHCRRLERNKKQPNERKLQS